MFFSDTYSYDPVEVIEHLLRYLDNQLSAARAKQSAREILASIPKLVPLTKEWWWHGTILYDRNENSIAIMLEAAKPKRRWRHKIGLTKHVDLGNKSGLPAIERHPKFLRQVAKAREQLRAGKGVRLEDLPK